MSFTLKNSKLYKDNLDKNERKALKEFWTDTWIVILLVMKATATIILDYEDYVVQCMKYINHESHKLLDKNPTTRIKDKILKTKTTGGITASILHIIYNQVTHLPLDIY